MIGFMLMFCLISAGVSLFIFSIENAAGTGISIQASVVWGYAITALGILITFLFLLAETLMDSQE